MDNGMLNGVIVWKSKLITFKVKGETHVHESFRRYKVFSLIAFKECDGKMLDQSVEGLLRHSLVVHSLNNMDGKLMERCH